MTFLRSVWPLLAVWFIGDVAMALSGDTAGAIRFAVCGALLALLLLWSRQR